MTTPDLSTYRAIHHALREAAARIVDAAPTLDGTDPTHPGGNRRKERLTITADVVTLYRAWLRSAGVVTAAHLEQFLAARPGLGELDRGLFLAAFENAGGATTLDGSPVTDGLLASVATGGAMELLLHAEGRLLHLGRSTRTFDAAQRRAVLAATTGVGGAERSPRSARSTMSCPGRKAAARTSRTRSPCVDAATAPAPSTAAPPRTPNTSATAASCSNEPDESSASAPDRPSHVRRSVMLLVQCRTSRPPLPGRGSYRGPCTSGGCLFDCGVWPRRQFVSPGGSLRDAPDRGIG